MFNYYTLVLMICWMGLLVLSILVQENDRLRQEDKRLLFLTYLLIAASALAEWLGLYLDGRAGVPRWMLAAAKAADYTLTPMAGATLVFQMRMKNVWRTVMDVVLGVNIVLQVASLFFGWMVTIDASGHYTHGPLYGVYVAVYLTVVVILGIEFILYGKEYRRQNRLSLYAILLLVVIGIGMQEIVGTGSRTVYLALTLGASLMYIHYTEFSQLATDDHLARQSAQIATDPLTGLRSRFSYIHDLEAYDAAGALPGDLAAFMIDVNDLKATNDSRGHEAGDELLRGAARCIEAAFQPGGRCYRTGGDEFVVLANLPPEQTLAALERLQQACAEWKGTLADSLRVSAGCAHTAEHPGLNCEQLVREADQKMYAAKAAYYQRFGHDRRRRRDDRSGAGTSARDERSGAGTSARDERSGAGTSARDERSGAGTFARDERSGAGTSAREDQTPPPGQA